MVVEKTDKKSKNYWIVLALLAVYFIWGSTYLAIRIGLESFPPFLMIGSRFLLAGAILLIYLLIRKAPLPDLNQWKNSMLIGTLMLGGGVGGTAFSVQWINSGIAAIGVATVPLWAAIFSGLFGKWPARTEWFGIMLGFLGVAALSLDDNLKANPIGAITILIASASWAFGSVISRRVSLPPGPMGFAAELLSGGGVLLIAGLIRGERIHSAPTSQAILAWIYLVFFGSIIAFSAYMYLLDKVQLTLATSYAYVNPIVAVVLGIFLAEEEITVFALIGMAVILVSVGIITLSQKRKSSIK